MRTNIPILAATLALTVFLTSLVLESGNDSRANITFDADNDVVPFGHRILLERAQDDGGAFSILVDKQESGTGGDDLLSQGRQFWRAGNFEGAVELLRRALEIEPDKRETLRFLGSACFERRDYGASEKYLLRLVALEAEVDPVCRMYLGVAQMRQQKYGAALGNLMILLRENPKDGALHFALACVYSRLLDVDRAIYHLQVAYTNLGGSILSHISDPQLDNLRNHKTFQQIVRTARIQQSHVAVATPTAGGESE